MLSELACFDVHTYAGSFFTWDDKDEVVADAVWEHNGEPVTYRLPSVESNLRLVFSHQQHAFVVATYSSWQSKNEATRRAIDWNLAHQIRPEWISEPFDDEFTNAYRQAYTQKLLTQGVEQSLQLAPPTQE